MRRVKVPFLADPFHCMACSFGLDVGQECSERGLNPVSYQVCISHYSSCRMATSGRDGPKGVMWAQWAYGPNWISCLIV